MASYTSTKASTTTSSKADSVDFTFDISSAITEANIPAYSTINKVTITVWGDINTATNRGKMNAYFGSEQIGSEIYVGGTANEQSVSEDLNISTFFNSGNANAGKLKNSSTRLTVNINGPVMLSKFNHTASWQITIEWEPPTIRLIVEAGTGGKVKGGVYAYVTTWESTCYITATPDEGYKFVKWVDSNGNTYSTDASAPFTISHNDISAHETTVTFTAYFEKLKYTVSTAVSPTGYGTVTGGGTYEHGATATLTATANLGYKFVKWNDNVTTNPRSVTVTGAASYTANFEKLPPPEFTSASMTYLNKQISASNKVIHNEGFIISVGVK